MKLTDRINHDLAEELRSRNSFRVSVLRLLKNSLKNEQIKAGHELTDSEALGAVRREAKQRRESIAAYTEGGRQDLVDQEQAELKVILDYLPQEMSEDEVRNLVDQVVADAKSQGMDQMGPVIAAVVKKAAGRADGSLVARLVRERLG